MDAWREEGHSTEHISELQEEWTFDRILEELEERHFQAMEAKQHGGGEGKHAQVPLHVHAYASSSSSNSNGGSIGGSAGSSSSSEAAVAHWGPSSDADTSDGADISAVMDSDGWVLQMRQHLQTAIDTAIAIEKNRLAQKAARLEKVQQSSSQSCSSNSTHASLSGTQQQQQQ